jgi:hypothetical protein
MGRIILPIGQKIFEEKWKPLGMTVKSTGSEGITIEMTSSGELTGFGPANDMKGTIVGTIIDTRGSSGISTGTGQGILNTTGGDMGIWKIMYAGRPTGSGGQKWIGTVTFMTMSKNLAWLNDMICVLEGGGEADPTKPGSGTFYEWVP